MISETFVKIRQRCLIQLHRLVHPGRRKLSYRQTRTNYTTDNMYQRTLMTDSRDYCFSPLKDYYLLVNPNPSPPVPFSQLIPP